MPTQIDRSSSEAGDVPGAQALVRGLDVLLAVGSATQPVRFRDLELAVAIPRASLHRLLSALASRRLISYDDRTRTYQVGTGILELSRRTLDQSTIVRAAKPELARLARRLQRTVCMTVLDGHEIFVLDFDDMDASCGRLVRSWPRAPALDTAAGRALLSAMPKERSEALIADMGRDPGTLGKLGAELGIAKALGYAVLAREPASGRAGVAAAVLDETGHPSGAISCLFEIANVPAEELHETGRIVAEGARRASGHMAMGFPMPTVLPGPPGPIGSAVEVLPTGRDFVGENPIWNAGRGRLYWVDVLAPALRWWEPTSRTSSRIELQQITAGIAFDDQDRLIGAGQSGIFAIDPDSGAASMLINPEADRPDNRFNTAGVDPRGRFWVGSMALDHEPGAGSLYSIEPDLSVERRIERLGLPRNVAFDPAGERLYLSDASEGGILAFDFDLDSGGLGNRRLFLDNDAMPGRPNGITVDADGCLWVTCTGGWSVRRYRDDGTLDAEIPLPFPMPTNCAFGGPDLTTLFVTSTYIRMPAGFSAKAPAAGQLVAVRTGVRGMPSMRFRVGR